MIFQARPLLAVAAAGLGVALLSFPLAAQPLLPGFESPDRALDPPAADIRDVESPDADPPPLARRPAPTFHAIAARGASAVGRAPGHVLVRFETGLAPGLAKQIASGLGAPRVRPARFGEFSRVDVPAGRTAEQVAADFRAHPSVRWAETDPLVRAAATSVRATANGASAAAAITDDPFFSRQWHLERIGLDEALQRNPADGAGVIVAVLDSGVAFGSGNSYPVRPVPDLGSASFVPGFDFVDNDPVALDLGIAGDDTPTGVRFSHGTFAASIIAATVNNGLAGAGIAPRAAIMPVRVLGIDGSGFSSDIAEGIRFAVDNGARVINLSLGGSGIATVTREALNYAHSRGVVVVAASGNDADDSEVFEGEFDSDVAYPARYPTVIAVGATAFDGRRADYSNFGPGLDLVAPAGEGASNEVAPGVRDAVLATGFLFDPVSRQELYGGFWATGTSFACPQAAGVAALLLSLGVDDPDAVRTLLELTARDLGPAGFDTDTGSGQLDAAAAHRGLGFTQ